MGEGGLTVDMLYVGAVPEPWNYKLFVPTPTAYHQWQLMTPNRTYVRFANNSLLEADTTSCIYNIGVPAQDRMYLYSALEWLPTRGDVRPQVRVELRLRPTILLALRALVLSVGLTGVVG